MQNLLALLVAAAVSIVGGFAYFIVLANRANRRYVELIEAIQYADSDNAVLDIMRGKRDTLEAAEKPSEQDVQRHNKAVDTLDATFPGDDFDMTYCNPA